MCVLATLLCHREPLYAMEAQCTRCFHALICTDTVAQHRVDRPRFECAEVWLALQMTQTPSIQALHSSNTKTQLQLANHGDESCVVPRSAGGAVLNARQVTAPPGAARSVAHRPAGYPGAQVPSARARLPAARAGAGAGAPAALEIHRDTPPSQNSRHSTRCRARDAGEMIRGRHEVHLHTRTKIPTDTKHEHTNNLTHCATHILTYSRTTWS